MPVFHKQATNTQPYIMTLIKQNNTSRKPYLPLLLFFLLLPFLPKAATTTQEEDSLPAVEDSVADSTYINKVLFIGDSMTGWMAERLNAYGEINGFEVATVVWDGSTISKWASSPALSKIIYEQKPDAIIVSLGMNEMFETRPEARLKNSVDTLVSSFGNLPFLWIGPPSWPGHSEGEVFNAWMQKELGQQKYFRSFNLDLSRQSKSNPHPSRAGIEEWVDEVVEWIPLNSELNFHSLSAPEKGKVSRGETFIYKRMNENL